MSEFFSFPKRGVFLSTSMLVGKRVSGDYQFGTWKLQIDSDAKIPNHLIKVRSLKRRKLNH